MSSPVPAFNQALRGYDRVEVDRFVAQVGERWAALEAERDTARRRSDLAEQHAVATEDENRALRAAARSGPSPDAGFGARAERLLRMAEQEAVEVRSATAREAAHLLDAARREIELHRDREERALAGRIAAAEQLLGERVAELRERERALADQMHAARTEADALVGAARAEAGRLRAGAAAEADGQRRRAAQDIARMRVAATDELARLAGVRATVLADLDRLLALVTGPGLRTPPIPRQVGPTQAGPTQAGPSPAGPARDGRRDGGAGPPGGADPPRPVLAGAGPAGAVRLSR